MKSKKNLLVSVVGPTAVGKTKLAIDIARYFGTEILSADSRQFYREMEIGTAKPSSEELSSVKHHFINNLSITDEYTVGQFERDAVAILTELFERHRVVVMVGGSGLFFKAVWQGLDEMPAILPETRNELNEVFQREGLAPLLTELEGADPIYYQKVDRKNHQRVIRALEVIRSTGKPFSGFRKERTNQRDFENLKIGLDMDRPELFERIDSRMDSMISSGLFEEAERLIAHKNRNALQTVGYSEIYDFMDGAYDREEAVRLLKRNSRRYAKRQLTWFRRDEEILWYEPNKTSEIIRLIENRLDT